MAFRRILFGSIAAAVVYGILPDQITARVCVEYFTIGHPRIIASESPTLLAFAWGVVATWWVGLILITFLRRWRRSRCHQTPGIPESVPHDVSHPETP